MTDGGLDAERRIVDGRYRVLERIGSGGMADVYCAEDLQLGRKVALKLLHRRFAEDARVRRALPPRGLGRRRPAAPATSSASTTAASGTAPTTSRWSTSRGAR